MQGTAEKSKHTTIQPRSEMNGGTFFRKAGEGGFFGQPANASFFAPAIQAKLNVSSPDDPQEKEADAMADKVMRMAGPAPVAPAPKEEEKLQRKEEEKEEEVQAMAEPSGILLKCENCEREEKKVQAKYFTAIQRSEEISGSADAVTDVSGDAQTVDRKAIPMHRSDVIQLSGRGPPLGSMHGSFEQGLSSSRGGGSALPGHTLQFMESRFNADFSGVRIHTGSQAEALSSSIHAQAFTHGNDIYFNKGKYSPDTGQGGTLLAHELTHTIQQGASQHVPASQVARKTQPIQNTIQRSAAGVPSQLTNAVEKAKTVEGKIDANKPQPDGNRTGYEHLIEIFKTTFGADMVIGGSGGTAVKGAVAEQDIKKKRLTTGMIVDKTTITDRNKIPGTTTGERDAMPSWCGIFVFWALNKSGVPMPKWKLGERMIPPEAARSPGTMPLPGDIAYRNAYSHYAIVESVSGSTIRTVNGNTAGEDNLGGQVQTIDHPVTEWTAFFNPLQVMTGSLGEGEGTGNPEPKSIADLRKENKLQAKEEEQKPEQEEGPGKVQAQPELSTWNVDAKGTLQTGPTVQQEALEKEPEEKKEEEEKAVGETAGVQRMPVAQTTVRGPPEAGTADIQRSPIDDALSHTSLGQLLDCVYITDINATSVCLLRKASSLAMYVPGYKALRVVLGRDPISGDPVARSGHNLLDAAFDIMPGGELFKQKLQETGRLDAAAEWIDTKIAYLEDLVDGLFASFDNFWNALGLTDFGSPMDVLRRGFNIVYGFISDLINFAIDTAKELLRMVKDFLLSKIVEFIKTQTNAYPLLTLILGEDPITKQPVDRNGANILNAILELGGEEGRQQRTKMTETGTFDKVAAYIDEGIEVFGDLYDTIVNGFSTIWDIITIDALMEPIETFRRIYNVFAAPVARVLNFMLRVGAEILKLVKEAMMQSLSDWARTVRGYPLLTVIIGKDPFTNEKVPFTMENVIKGFFSLMDGGIEQYNQLKESGAIDRTVAKVTAAVRRLNMTVASIVQLFIDLWNSFSIRDLLNPIAAFRRILDRFGAPILRLINFVIEIVKIVIEAILIVMNFPFDIINNIIAKAMAAFERIKRDPVAFLKNLLRAIKQGFVQFFGKILTHLLGGLADWFFFQLKDLGIQKPADLSLASILKLVMEILGISLQRIMEKVWKKLEEKIGREKVEKIKKVIDKLEGIWKFIKDVMERGPVAIWEFIQEKISTLWSTILDAAKNFIMERIINAVVTKLLSMLDPTGIMAVVNSVLAIYRAIQSFIAYIRQMLEIVNSFVEGVAEIANGNIKVAADFVERSMVRAIPIVIGFLANQVGLGKVADKLKEVIETIREKIDKAIDWLVDKAVNMGMAILNRLVSMAKSAKDAVLGLLGLKKPFQTKDGKSHSLYTEGSGTATKFIVASTPKTLEELATDRKKTLQDEITANPAKASENNPMIAALDDAVKIKKTIEPILKKYNDAVDNKSDSEANEMKEKINKKMDEILGKLIIAGVETEGSNNVETKVTHSLTSHNRPQKVTAWPLTKIPGNTAGSTPQERPEGWDYIPASANPSTNWVGAHLLNHHLHGPGVAWNMVNGTKETNNNMKTEVENTAKKDIANNPTKQYYFEATVTYYVEPSKVPGIPPFPEKIYFPSKVDTEFGELNGDGGNYTKGKLIASRPFTQDSPTLSKTDMASFNESSASALYDASVKAGLTVSKDIMKLIVEARRTIPTQSFGNNVHNMIAVVDDYAVKNKGKAKDWFKNNYSGNLVALSNNFIFMDY